MLVGKPVALNKVTKKKAKIDFDPILIKMSLMREFP